jgi:SH3-like domain-containing protein
MPKILLTLLVMAAFVFACAAPALAQQKKKAASSAPNPRYASMLIRG